MVERRFYNSDKIACLPTIFLLVLIFLLAACISGNAQSLALSLAPAESDNREPVEKLIVPSGLTGLVTKPPTDPPAPSLNDPPIERAKPVKPKGVSWKGVLGQSAFFLGVEQAYRIGTQPGTRNALKGPFFEDWLVSASSTHGWGDADDFLTNYIGHPMEGAVVGSIFVQNDPKGRTREFSWESGYWTSRLKATAWSALYSTQFELGPAGEAAIGNVGYPGQSLAGWVDLVVTPVAGLGWQVGEDALDKYLIVKIENWTGNRFVLTLTRGFLNPCRSFANVMRLKVPWHRDLRPGIWTDRSGNR